MDDVLTRLWQEIAARPSGPLAIRFYLQPIMAAIVAVRDGIRDARSGNPAYLWAAFTDPAHRRELLRDGWHSIAKIVAMAVVVDLAYQLMVLRGLRPVQTVIIAVLLAILPYVLLRGPANRVMRLRGGSKREARHGV